MLIKLFYGLKEAQIPVSITEHLLLIEALECGCANFSIDDFYHLARSALVKDERYLDRFDLVFSHIFKGVGEISAAEAIAPQDIPHEWLEKLAEKFLSDEEKAEIQSLGGFKELMEALKERLETQKDRHQGGNKWIGTAGASPFGAYGYNPEGVRIGQHESRHQRAVKVWDKREFKDLDDSREIGTRNIKMALRRLRQFVRDGAGKELDLDKTIKGTAHQGYLDIHMRPERRNGVKVLLLFDIGGSMDWHVEQVEDLFSAARAEFKHMDYYYFHNCIYEAVWKSNARRRTDLFSTYDLIHTYPNDYKVIFVGDAAMSPYEIAFAGGAVEHWNEEAGQVWLERLRSHFKHTIWLNPAPQTHWPYTQSTVMINEIFEGQMYPLTLSGLETAMRALLQRA